MTDNTTLGAAEIEHRFGFHKATIEGDTATKPKHVDLRVQFRDFVEYLDRTLPAGREKSLAMTAAEEASMWSHKALAKTAPLISDEDANPAPDDYSVDQDEYGEPPTLPSKFE